MRSTNQGLVGLLESGDAASHPFVIGELACGRLPRRLPFLELLARLPRAPIATHDEAMSFVDRHRLAATGIGWVDVHLLASTRLAGTRLWTLDRRLRAVAGKLGLLATDL